jgi:hypothetical protein
MTGILPFIADPATELMSLAFVILPLLVLNIELNGGLIETSFIKVMVEHQKKVDRQMSNDLHFKPSLRTLPLSASAKYPRLPP